MVECQVGVGGNLGISFEMPPKKLNLGPCFFEKGYIKIIMIESHRGQSIERCTNHGYHNVKYIYYGQKYYVIENLTKVSIFHRDQRKWSGVCGHIIHHSNGNSSHFQVPRIRRYFSHKDVMTWILDGF